MFDLLSQFVLVYLMSVYLNHSQCLTSDGNHRQVSCLFKQEANSTV